jgi:hypothetical protein
MDFIGLNCYWQQKTLYFLEILGHPVSFAGGPPEGTGNGRLPK